MTELPEPALKNCPFCGSEAEIRVWETNGIVIRCTWCGIKHEQKVLCRSVEWLRAVMINSWNLRIPAAVSREPLRPFHIL